MRSKSAVLAVLLAACGADPEPEPGELVSRRTEIGPGGTCDVGGVRIEIGHDDDGDGELDDREVEDAEVICDPAQRDVVVRTDAIAPGDVCPAGGVAVHTGVDDDDDGSLDDSEIDDTVTVCDVDEVLEGDFTTSDWESPSRVALLQQATVVTGSLDIASHAPVALPKLQLVGGDLSVYGNLASLDISGLRQVVGNVDVDTPGLDDLTLPALETIGGDVFVTSNGVDGEQIAAPALRSIGGGVVFWWGTQGEIVMPQLASIGGGLRLDGQISALHLDALAEIHGDLMYDDLALDELDLPALRVIDGELNAIFAGSLTRIALPALERVGEVRLANADALTEVDLAGLQQVDVRISIGDLPALTALSFPALTAVGDDLVLTDLPALTTLSAPVLTNLNADATDPVDERSLLIAHTGLVTLSLPSLRTAGGGVDVVHCPALTSVAFESLETAGIFGVAFSPQVVSIRVPALVEARNVDAVEAESLVEYDLSSLERVTYLDLRDAELTSLQLGSLEQVGVLRLDNLDQLTDLAGLAGVASVGTLEIENCAALTSLHGLESVERIPGMVFLYNNPALASLDGLEHVTQVGGQVVIQHNVGLTSLAGLEALRAINGSLGITWNTALTSLDGLGALTWVGDGVSIANNTALPPDEIAELQAQLD